MNPDDWSTCMMKYAPGTVMSRPCVLKDLTMEVIHFLLKNLMVVMLAF